MKLLTKQKHTHRLRKQTYGYQSRKVGRRDKSGAWDEHTNSVCHICVYMH